MSSILQPCSNVATLSFDVTTLDLVFSMFHLGFDVVTQEVDVAMTFFSQCCNDIL